jgi:Protein of unknown function (DUF3179)
MTKVRSRIFWVLLSVFGVVGFGSFMFPAFVIRPFTRQSPRGLWWAMAVRQRAPIVSLLCAIVCMILVSILWPKSSKWSKGALSVIMALVVAAATMSRLNYFEWMFHPVDAPEFLSESSSKLDSKEMILAVTYGSDARAYPISQMAYHHILNDVVGGVPIAVTY